MKKPDTLSKAYRLMHEGAEALAAVEAAGIRVDTDYLEHTIADTREKIREMEVQLKGSKEFQLQKKRFGDRTILTSRKQLGEILFGEMGMSSTATTATGRRKLDESVLEAIGTPYTKGFLRLEKLRKLNSTYLNGVLKETSNGYLHPFFNLHLASTYRGSSDHPNFQNIPIRDPEIAKLIRTAFVPRDDHVLVEIDYGALEFRVAACFWEDDEMIQYASVRDKDIHRDCAAEIFLVDNEEVSKEARYCGKNMFVFPQLYGDYYVNNAKYCWEAMDKLGLKLAGSPTYISDHLKQRGIATLNQFEYHMRGVEETFYSWFPGFAAAKDKWWDDYRKRGYFDLMTGFRLHGAYSRNFVMNAPIQGPAFHLLLWSLTRLVRWLQKSKMRTKIVGQIHDSIVADVYLPEYDEYFQKAKQVMTEDVRKHWDWIVTPLEIAVEIAERNWFEKSAVEI